MGVPGRFDVTPAFVRAFPTRRDHGFPQLRLLRHARTRRTVEHRDLRTGGWLPSVAEDPRGEDSTGGGRRRGQEVGPSRARRGRIPRGAEVELHAQGIRGPDVRGVQLRRERARNVQGPRYPALQSPRPGRGDGDRRLRHGRHRRLQLHPRRVHGRAVHALRAGGGVRLRDGAARPGHPRLGRGLPTSTPRWARAPTSAARRPP